MKESYPEEIMLCFVQGFGNGSERSNCRDYKDKYVAKGNDDGQIPKKKIQHKRVSLQLDEISDKGVVELRSSIKSSAIVAGKSLRLSTSGDRFMKRLPEVKRSFSDRFSVIGDPGGRSTPRGLLTIRKTRSASNFAGGGGAGGAGGAARSAPSSPLQIEPPRQVKHDKHAVKPLSSSTPSVRAVAPGAGTAAGTGASSDASEGKAPSKARQKKFLRHFPQVGPDERVLNYYSCALVGDILLQGHLYITKNYFAFYSNVFGYVTKLLIPTASVQRVSKEKMARIIPNAVGVCTRDERHVFGSLLSRDNTYKLMTHVWKLARAVDEPPPHQELPISEVELDASEYSPEDESSSGGGGGRGSRAHTPLPPAPAADAILTAVGGGVATIIQPALLTGGVSAAGGGGRPRLVRAALLSLAALLALSALYMAYQLHNKLHEEQSRLSELSGAALSGEVARWRARLHGRAAHDLHGFLHTNLVLLAKVRQSLETLSNVILADLAPGDAALRPDLPNDTTFS